MAYPTSSWLLEPIFPALPALPRLEQELYALEAAAQPSEKIADPSESTAQHPSGTWRVGTREPEPVVNEADRFGTSDSEAPTVRPGSMRLPKRR